MTAPTTVRVLQRVVLPSGENLDVVPLYVETDVDRGGTSGSVVVADAEVAAPAAVGVSQAHVRFGSALGTDWDATLRRRSAVVAAGARASFATYFNAFPAGYWRRWTDVTSVLLRLRLVGSGSVIVYRSSAKGHSHPVHTVPFDCSAPEDLELSLPLTQFVDGGWYWFDVAAGQLQVTLVAADWAAAVTDAPAGRVSIGITTFNRPTYCLDQLRALGAADDVLEVLDRVHVIDQGTERVGDEADFADATKALGDRLRVVQQRNLGGSGGFSRAMADTLDEGTSDYVLLLDDDVVLEPEGILRAVTFADLAREPVLVGGHMFSMHDRSVLHAFGETVAPYPWWWGAAPHTASQHDFGRRNLRNTPWLHRRVDVDYNGWWMCLLPTKVVREIGLSLPLFIKWDDAEYGLRAAEAGYRTVSLPGVAAWHVPWDDKTDAVDWQAYYHLRNRLVSALLHTPFERGGGVVGACFETQMQHLLSMQYSTAELRLAALEDVLSGPEHLHRTLPTRLAQLRAMQKAQPDGATRADLTEFPAPRRRRPPKRASGPRPPANGFDLVARAAVAAARQFAPVPVRAADRPDLQLPHQDAQWWSLAGLDSAVVSSADGTGAAWYRRDPAQWRALLRRSITLHARLVASWPQLRRSYRACAPELTAPEAWRETFGADVSG